MTPAIPKPAKTNTDKMSSKSPKSPKNREPRPPKKKEDLEKDTVWFLITCIMESASGKIEKIDFESVAEKLNIKSKVAAQWRLLRLLGSYGLTGSFVPKAGQAAGSPAGDSTASETATPTTKRKSTKRKRADTETPDGSVGDGSEV